MLLGYCPGSFKCFLTVCGLNSADELTFTVMSADQESKQVASTGAKAVVKPSKASNSADDGDDGDDDDDAGESKSSKQTRIAHLEEKTLVSELDDQGVVKHLLDLFKTDPEAVQEMLEKKGAPLTHKC